MRKILFWVLSLLLLLCSSLWAGERVRVCGSGDNQTILRFLAKAYTDLHPATTIEVPDSIGSSGAVKAVAAGKCVLGRISRPLRQDESSYGLSYLHFADSPVVFIANRSVQGVTTISDNEALGIYSGAITHWSLLGGPHEKIYVANREKGDSSLMVLEKHIPGFSAISKPMGETLFSTQENIAAVSSFRYTIGYASLPEALEGENLIILRLNGATPVRENIRNGAYRLVTPFGLIWKEPLPPAAKNFIDFLRTGEAEEIMHSHGVISVL